MVRNWNQPFNLDGNIDHPYQQHSLESRIHDGLLFLRNHLEAHNVVENERFHLVTDFNEQTREDPVLRLLEANLAKYSVPYRPTYLSFGNDTIEHGRQFYFAQLGLTDDHGVDVQVEAVAATPLHVDDRAKSFQLEFCESVVTILGADSASALPEDFPSISSEVLFSAIHHTVMTGRDQ